MPLRGDPPPRHTSGSCHHRQSTKEVNSHIRAVRSLVCPWVGVWLAASIPVDAMGRPEGRPMPATHEHETDGPAQQCRVNRGLNPSCRPRLTAFLHIHAYRRRRKSPERGRMTREAPSGTNIRSSQPSPASLPPA